MLIILLIPLLVIALFGSGSWFSDDENDTFTQEELDKHATLNTNQTDAMLERFGVERLQAQSPSEDQPTPALNELNIIEPIDAPPKLGPDFPVT